MADPRQYILLAIAVFVPVFLIMTGRERWLLAWVCFTLGINLFDTKIIVNLPAARIVGLVLIPKALQSLPTVFRSLPGRALVMQYVYLVGLGILFGFRLLWPDDGLIRTFNQVAPGRTIIYLIRTAADISLTFFVARQVMKWKHPDKMLRYYWRGGVFSANFSIIGDLAGFHGAGDRSGEPGPNASACALAWTTGRYRAGWGGSPRNSVLEPKLILAQRESMDDLQGIR